MTATRPSTRHRSLRPAGLVAVWLLVFASVVSWRQGVLYSGGADPVVVAKATVAGLAALGAVALWRTAPARRVLSPFPVLLVVAVVGVSLVGAIQAGELATNVVLAIRIALLTVSLVLIMASTPTREAITGMLVAMAAVGVFAAMTSIAMSAVSGGGRERLAGGIPPLEPNELATIVLPAAIGLTYVVVRHGIRLWPTAGLILLAGIIYETGSRAALAMLGVGALVIVLRERRLTFGVGVLVLVGLVVAYSAVMFSDVVTNLALRGQGVDRLLTLNSRTISWQAVLQTPSDEWAWWIGNGLSMKSIPVLGQFWSTQVFDSSWISSIAQDGMVGTVVLAVYVGGTLIAAFARRSLDSVVLAIAVTVFIRSFFENGLIESSATYAVFLTVALAVWPGTRQRFGASSDLLAPALPAAPRRVTVPVLADAQEPAAS